MPTVSRQIQASASQVWDLMIRTDTWPDWGPSVRSVDGPDRIEPASKGRIETAAGVVLTFRITEFDADERYWKWRVAGVNATGHRVEEIESDRCRASFEVPWWMAPYAFVCRKALRRIAHLAEDGPESAD